MSHDLQAVGIGAAVAVTVAVPATAIGAAIVDEGSAAVYVLAWVALAGYVAGGYTAAMRRPRGAFLLGALAALAAYVVAQFIAVVVNVAGDDDVNVVAILLTAIPAASFGLGGAAVALRRQQRPQRTGAS